MAKRCLNINSLEDYDKRVIQSSYWLEGTSRSGLVEAPAKSRIVVSSTSGQRHGFVYPNHEYLQGWNFHSLSECLIPMLNIDIFPSDVKLNVPCMVLQLLNLLFCLTLLRFSSLIFVTLIQPTVENY